MSKNVKLTGEEMVTTFIQQLDPGLGKVVETIRQIILSTDKEIGEQIKWNNPAFYFTGTMQAFDPKEYKRDIVVLNLFKGRIMLVFPSGEKLKDPTGLLEGNYKDGRRLIVFKDGNDVLSKATALQKIVKEWLKLVDR